MKNSYIVDLKEFEENVCKDCRKFIGKYKPWNDRKVPKVAIIDYAECKKCRMTYSIYKGMIWPIPRATRKESKEINRQLGMVEWPKNLKPIDN
ncbi:MAG TPA: hypothetical protein VJB05_03860 [archaeon]|nr:hypothetical protein [archaeon]